MAAGSSGVKLEKLKDLSVSLKGDEETHKNQLVIAIPRGFEFQRASGPSIESHSRPPAPMIQMAKARLSTGCYRLEVSRAQSI